MRGKRALTKGVLISLLVIGAPLLFVPEDSTRTRLLRFCLLLLLSLLILTTKLKQDISKKYDLPATLRYPLLIFSAGVILSTLFSDQSLEAKLLGLVPEYLGLLSWLCFVLLGFFVGPYIKNALLSRRMVLIGISVLIFSFFNSWFFVANGYRLDGVLFQPTTMGMYAAMLYVIGIKMWDISVSRFWRMASVLLALTSVAAVLLTQSRLAFFSVALVSSAIAYRYWFRRKMITAFAVMAVLMLVFLPRYMSNYFNRFGQQNVGLGLSYRLELYKVSASDVLHNNLFLGNGPNSLPNEINNQNMVPDDIQKSLQSGDVFLSSHDIFFDVAYFFGVVPSLALAILSFRAFYITLRKKKDYFMLALLSILLLNGLFNVSSLELTSILIVMVIALNVNQRISHGAKIP